METLSYPYGNGYKADPLPGFSEREKVSNGGKGLLVVDGLSICLSMV
jgi:hypothetical protein